MMVMGDDEKMMMMLMTARMAYDRVLRQIAVTKVMIL